MSTGTIRAALDFDDATPTCWKYQMTSDWAKAKAENTICEKYHIIEENINWHNKESVSQNWKK